MLALIMPTLCYLERRIQKRWHLHQREGIFNIQSFCIPAGEAREDWAIIRAFSGAIGKSIGMDSPARYAVHCARRAVFCNARLIGTTKWAKFVAEQSSHPSLSLARLKIFT